MESFYIIKLQKEEAQAIFFNISLLSFLPWIFLNWFVLAVKKIEIKNLLSTFLHAQSTAAYKPH